VVKTEKEMREEEVPMFNEIEELDEYIKALVDRQHDYGTCVYAMSLAAVASFNFVAHKLGVTGFQASCADLDIIRRTRRIKGPFILLKGEEMLYPQYNLEEKLREAMDGWKDWLSEQAEQKLSEDLGYVYPDVIEHWKALVERKK
jgi:hypothetical protein